MRAYGSRYLGDVRSFAIAYLLGLAALLPLILLNYGILGVFVYLFMGMLGGFNIAVFAALTAVFGNFGYKFLVFLLVIGVNAYWSREGSLFSIQPAPGVPNLNLVLFCQVTFLMGLFYAIQQRHKIGAQLRGYLDAEG